MDTVRGAKEDNVDSISLAEKAAPMKSEEDRMSLSLLMTLLIEMQLRDREQRWRL